jgi:hypothetical protein
VGSARRLRGVGVGRAAAFEVPANGYRLRIHGATGGGSDAEGGSPFFLVEVVNNDPQDGSDRLTFLGTHVVLDCGASFPTQFNSVNWTVIDPTSRALSSTALPTRAPKLNAWQTATLVMRVEFFGDLTVHAHVTEAKPD